MRYIWMLGIAVALVGGVGLLAPAHAADASWAATVTPAPATDGWGATVTPAVPEPKNLTEAVQLSQSIYCGARDVLASNLGLMLGFVLAATGLFQMIMHGISSGALITVIAGALLTSLPGLVENFFKGVVGVLGPLTTLTELNVPSCPGGSGAATVSGSSSRAGGRLSSVGNSASLGSAGTTTAATADGSDLSDADRAELIRSRDNLQALIDSGEVPPNRYLTVRQVIADINARLGQ